MKIDCGTNESKLTNKLTKKKKKLNDDVYLRLDIKTFETEFGWTNYVRRLTQRSSFTHLGRPKLQFSSSYLKLDA